MKMDKLGEIVANAGLSMEQFTALSGDERVDLVRSAGTMPGDCSPVPMGPARGACRAFMPLDAYPKGEDDWEWKPSGFAGRRALRMMDIFATMEAQAARSKRPAPFTPTQVAMARTYRGLVERHASAGMKCASLETSSGGSGQGGVFMDAVLRDRERIEIIRHRIGAGVALEVRRIRPSKRADGTGARPISDRHLVDMVCLEDMSMDAVLKAFGWSCKGATRAVIREALASSLDRMCGPRRRGDIRFMRLD